MLETIEKLSQNEMQIIIAIIGIIGTVTGTIVGLLANKIMDIFDAVTINARVCDICLNNIPSTKIEELNKYNIIFCFDVYNKTKYVTTVYNCFFVIKDGNKKIKTTPKVSYNDLSNIGVRETKSLDHIERISLKEKLQSKNVKIYFYYSISGKKCKRGIKIISKPTINIR